MFEQEPHPGMDRLRVDGVIIVEHEHKIRSRAGRRFCRAGAYLVQQCAQQHFDWRGWVRVQQRKSALADAGFHLLDRGDEVGPEKRGIVVVMVKRNPCHAVTVVRGCCEPFRQQRAFPEPGRRGNQRQLAVDPLLQALDKFLPINLARTPLRDIELGFK